jgi:hypothetical protein
MPSERVEVEGHIIDSLILAKVLDVILDAGADYQMLDVEIGRTNEDPSRACIEVKHDDEAVLERLLDDLHVHGANRVAQPDATLVPADVDGVLPVGFYSTTNLPTEVRVGGRWLAVENPEMDCAIVVSGAAEGEEHRVRTVPMHRVVAGELVVVGHLGVRVHALERPRGPNPFEFMVGGLFGEAEVAAGRAGRRAHPRRP